MTCDLFFIFVADVDVADVFDVVVVDAVDNVFDVGSIDVNLVFGKDELSFSSAIFNRKVRTCSQVANVSPFGAV